jgi:hypothetical protein
MVLFMKRKGAPPPSEDLPEDLWTQGMAAANAGQSVKAAQTRMERESEW